MHGGRRVLSLSHSGEQHCSQVRTHPMTSQVPEQLMGACGGTDGRNQVQGNTVSGVDRPRLLWGSSVPISSTPKETRSRSKQGSTE